MHLGVILIQGSDSNRISSKTHSLSSHVQFTWCLVQAQFPFCKQALSPIRAIGCHQDMNAVFFTLMGILPCWLLWFIGATAGQNCWLVLSQRSLDRTSRATKASPQGRGLQSRSSLDPPNSMSQRPWCLQQSRLLSTSGRQPRATTVAHVVEGVS